MKYNFCHHGYYKDQWMREQEEEEESQHHHPWKPHDRQRQKT